jgi:hypothetical protein
MRGTYNPVGDDGEKGTSFPTDRELLLGVLNAVGILYSKMTGQCLELPIETASGHEWLVSCGRRAYLAEHPDAAVSSPFWRWPVSGSKRSEGERARHVRPA